MSRVIVVKFGGNATENRVSRKKILANIITLNKKMPVLVVHGGGPQISKMMKDAGIKPRFVNGLRFTDRKTMEIAEKALAAINSSITKQINIMGGNAFGISCREGGLIVSKRVKELGYVGEVQSMDMRLPALLFSVKIVPVVMPVSSDGKKTTLNMNADTVATELAIAFRAERLVFLTDVPGVKDAGGRVIKSIKTGNIEKMIKTGVVTGGMIPKLKGCAAAIKRGVGSVQISDGTHGISAGAGTTVVK